MCRVFLVAIIALWFPAAIAAEEIKHHFDIPSLSVDAALKLLAQQSSTPLLLPYDQVKSISANELQGEYNLTNALSILLDGTGLISEVSEHRVITVQFSTAPDHKLEQREMMKNTRNKGTTALGGLVSVITALGGAGVSAADGMPNNGNGLLEEVVVTAQRRVENIQNVPISVSVFDTDLLNAAASDGGDIRFLSARTPSLKIESSFGRSFPRFYIRGLGNQDFDLNSSQPVSIVYDDVVQESPVLKGFPVFDVRSIEVLRGPQGTLFGRNTPAGLVKFTSNAPTQEIEGYLDTSYGSLDSVSIQGALSGGLTDTLSARISVLSQTREDWIDTLAPGFEQKDVLGGYTDRAARLQFLWQPNDDFSALFNYHIRDLDGTPTVFRASTIVPGSNSLVSGFKRDKIYHDAASRATQEVKVKGGSLKLEFVTGDHTLTSITGYETVEMFSRADVDGGYRVSSFGNPAGFTGAVGTVPLFSVETADGIPDHKQLTQEFRIASNELGRLDYQAGVFFYSEDLDIDSYHYSEDGTPKRFLQQNQETDAWAIFASADYDLSDQLKITAGLRYSKDKKDYVAQRRQSTSRDGNFFDPFTAKPNDSAVSWDISASYSYSDDINLYTRLAKGFRAPSIQGRIISGSSPKLSVADSETIHSLELGLKSDLLNGAARVNFNVFYFEMKDQQITAQSSFDAGAAKELLNLDKTVGYGFELDAQYALTENLLLGASMSYNNTEIKDNDAAIATCSFCTVNNPINAQGLTGVDGLSLPRAPEWIGNFTARYSREIGSGEFYAYTDWSYTSEVNFALIDSQEMQQDAYWEGGARIGYNWPVGDKDLEIAGFVRNINDETTLLGGLTINNLAGIVNQGRFWGANFKIAF